MSDYYRDFVTVKSIPMSSKSMWHTFMFALAYTVVREGVQWRLRPEPFKDMDRALDKVRERNLNASMLTSFFGGW